jgi:flagellar biosynthesis/type III secretory pathway chaperone
MTHDDFAELIADLDALLEDERAALLAGDLEKVASLLERKEAIIDALALLDAADAEALQSLNKKLHRNQALLDQALEGIRSVAKRLSALRQVRRSLDTYDEKGEKKVIDMDQTGTLEKRA